tara:strand:+ start:1627 stop:1959 length:333 start_codon:yes stop_codon:yes gene_type:complete
MGDHAIMNHRDCEPEDIIHTDSQGSELTHRILAERLVQVHCQKISEDASHGDHAYLASIFETGFRGFHNMGQKELIDEWREQEEQFFEMLDQGSFLYQMDPEDPLAKRNT